MKYKVGGNTQIITNKELYYVSVYIGLSQSMYPSLQKVSRFQARMVNGHYEASSQILWDIVNESEKCKEKLAAWKIKDVHQLIHNAIEYAEKYDLLIEFDDEN